MPRTTGERSDWPEIEWKIQWRIFNRPHVNAFLQWQAKSQSGGHNVNSLIAASVVDRAGGQNDSVRFAGVMIETEDTGEISSRKRKGNVHVGHIIRRMGAICRDVHWMARSATSPNPITHV